jgi:hypothetical protein
MFSLQLNINKLLIPTAIYSLIWMQLGCEVRSKEEANAPVATAAPNESAPESQPGSAEQPKALTTEDGLATLSVIPEAEPNQYSVSILFKNELLKLYQNNPKLIQVIRSEINGADAQILQMNGTGILDTKVKVNTDYEYKIVTYEKGVAEELETLKAHIPRDYVFSGEKIQQYDMNMGETAYGRVFFKNGAKLITSGFGIKIFADQIVSENGQITGYSEEMKGQALSTQRNGENGQFIEIKANSIVGQLQFDLDGMPGSYGIPGAPPTDTMRGSQGSPGYISRLGFVDTPTKICSNLQSVYRGEVGGQGAPGNNGGAGFSGGNSIGLRLMVKNLSTENWQIRSRRPGAGGFGGMGGAGGLGGEGGPGIRLYYHDVLSSGKNQFIDYNGDYSINFISTRIDRNSPLANEDMECFKKSAKGMDGARGDTGIQGPKGSDGSLSPVCINENCF